MNNNKNVIFRPAELEIYERQERRETNQKTTACIKISAPVENGKSVPFLKHIVHQLIIFKVI